MKRRMIFGLWEPDAVAMASGDVIPLRGCTNVVRTTRGYRNIAKWDQAIAGDNFYSGTVTAYTSICGALSTLDEDGYPVDFISTTTAVYAADGATKGISAVTGSTANARPTGAECYRDFCQYGNYVITASGGVSAASDPTYYEHGSSSVFATLTTAFKARTVAAVRDFVVFGYTYDATDGERPTRVRWSAFGDPFTYTPSAATQSDFQDLQADIGRIQKIVGGDIGYIVGTDGVYIAEYVGPPLIFRFTYAHPGIGTDHPQSCVLSDGRLYLYSRAGFVSLGPTRGDVQKIGSGRVDATFDQEYRLNNAGNKIIGYRDALHEGIGWMVDRRETGWSGNAYFYHTPSDSWALHARDDAWFVYGSKCHFVTTYGARETAAAITSAGLLVQGSTTSDGAPATLKTGAEQLQGNGRAIVERIFPLVECPQGALTAPGMVVTSRSTALVADSAVSQSYGTWNSTVGYWTGHDGAGFRDGRYHEFEMLATSAFANTQFIGIDVVFHPRGEY